MRLADLTRDTWPSLEELFSANRTVAGCYCTWFMRTGPEMEAQWGAGNKAFLHEKVRAGEPLGVLALTTARATARSAGSRSRPAPATRGCSARRPRRPTQARAPGR